MKLLVNMTDLEDFEKVTVDGVEFHILSETTKRQLFSEECDSSISRELELEDVFGDVYYLRFFIKGPASLIKMRYINKKWVSDQKLVIPMTNVDTKEYDAFLEDKQL